MSPDPFLASISGSMGGMASGALVGGGVGVWFGGVGFLPGAIIGGIGGGIVGGIVGASSAWSQTTFSDGWNAGVIPGVIGGAFGGMIASGLWVAMGAGTMEVGVTTAALQGGGSSPHVIVRIAETWYHALGAPGKMKALGAASEWTAIACW